MTHELTYDLIFEAIRDPLMIVDASGDVLRANSASRALSRTPVLARITDLPKLDAVAPDLLEVISNGGESANLALAGIDVIDVTTAGAPATRLVHVHPRTAEFWKDEMIAMVSHEIKNPLSAMKNSVDILLSQIPGELTDGQRRFLDTSGRNIDRLTHLLDGFLDVSRIRSGAFVVEQQRTNVRAFVTDMIESFRTLFNVRRVNLAFSVDEYCGWAWIDAPKLEQVVINLLSNALKFTPEDGSIVVDVSTVGIETLDDDLRLLPWDELGRPRILEISVRDTGLGMSSEALAAIYERFRGDSPVNDGTHLGLNISRTLVEALEGRIHVASTPGIGTRATVRVPKNRATATVISRARSLDSVLRTWMSRHEDVEFYMLGKYSDDDWQDIAGTWNCVPVVNPVVTADTGASVVLWTLGGTLAVALSRGGGGVERIFGPSAALVDDGAHVFNGYAAGMCRVEVNTSAAQLFNVAVTRMSRARNAMAQANIESLDSRVEYVTRARESLAQTDV